MNCPDCGSTIKEDQQFCRSCGAALPDAPRRMRRQFLMLISMILTFLGIIVAISGDIAAIGWLKFTGVFIAISGMFSIVIGSLILQMRRPVRTKPTNAAQSISAERADTTNKLLPVGENDFIPSVVENTTDLLEPVQREQKGKTA